MVILVLVLFPDGTNGPNQASDDNQAKDSWCAVSAVATNANYDSENGNKSDDDYNGYDDF